MTLDGPNRSAMFNSIQTIPVDQSPILVKVVDDKKSPFDRHRAGIGFFAGLVVASAFWVTTFHDLLSCQREKAFRAGVGHWKIVDPVTGKTEFVYGAEK